MNEKINKLRKSFKNMGKEEFKSQKILWVFPLALVINILFFLPFLYLVLDVSSGHGWGRQTTQSVLLAYLWFTINLISLIILFIFIKEEYRIKKWVLNLGIFIFPLISLGLIYSIIKGGLGIFFYMLYPFNSMGLFFIFITILFILISFYWIKYRTTFER